MNRVCLGESVQWPAPHLSIDTADCAVLILLNLSAAFNTTDDNIELTRLEFGVGVGATALTWFTSYLSNRKSSSGSIGNPLCPAASLSCGVPLQGLHPRSDSVLSKFFPTVTTFKRFPSHTALSPPVTKHELKTNGLHDDLQWWFTSGDNRHWFWGSFVAWKRTKDNGNKNSSSMFRLFF